MSTISQDADGWQVPIGLTAAEAICIEDSDSDREEENCCKVIDQVSTPFGVSAGTLSEDATPREYVSDEPGNIEEENNTTNEEVTQKATVGTKQMQDKNKASGETPADTNPFACFAFVPIRDKQSVTDCSLKRTHHNLIKTRRAPIQTTDCSLKRSKLCGTSKDRVPKQHLSCNPPEEITEECTVKWHSFAVSTDPIELQRFHVLIAARLHARCQENTVRTAMNRLRSFFESRDGLNPRSLSKTNHEEIAPLLSSVLFGNTKAKQLVQAAHDVVRMGGEVPETNEKLQKITGIGPKLAYILCKVNTRATFYPTKEPETKS